MYYVISTTTDRTICMTKDIKIAEMVSIMVDEPCVIRKGEK